MFRIFIYITLIIVYLLSGCVNKEPQTEKFPRIQSVVPLSLTEEHTTLLNMIHKISTRPDSSGRVAIKLYELLQHHFKEEENYVLPPLGLLPQLTKGELPADTEQVIALTEKLIDQMQHMDIEHQMVRAYLNELKTASEKDTEVLKLEQELSKHAQMEEEILFPTSLLIGEHLKLLKKKPPGSK